MDNNAGDYDYDAYCDGLPDEIVFAPSG